MDNSSSTTEAAFADIDSISLTVYTEENENISSPSSMKKNLVGIIVGISLVVIILLSLVSIAIIYKTLQKKRKLNNETELESFIIIKEAKIISSIGSGNFGVVYKGIAFGGSPVALKCMKLEDEQEILAEAEILARVQHVILACDHLLTLTSQPNCVRFFGIFKEEGKIYLVTEFCSGGGLLDLITKTSLSNSDLLSK